MKLNALDTNFFRMNMKKKKKSTLQWIQMHTDGNNLRERLIVFQHMMFVYVYE